MSDVPSISADGRYVAFQSGASNLVEEDTNNSRDAFVHDRQTGQTARAPLASSGLGSNGWTKPSISADGRYIAFESTAGNLVPEDTNHRVDVFVHDRQTGITTRISAIGIISFGYPLPNLGSISASGRYIAFSVVPWDEASKTGWYWRQVYVHDVQTGQNTLVSVGLDFPNIQIANSDSTNVALSANGRYVVFTSTASDLVAGDTNNTRDLFLHDRGVGDEEPPVTPEPTPTTTIDIGFRPNPDGFKFKNWGINFFNPNSWPYKWEDLVQMFGRDSACAYDNGNTCIPKLSALIWLIEANELMRPGLCYGLATSSLLFFQGKERDKPFNLRSGITYSLERGDAERHIAWNFVKQNTEPVLSYRTNSMQKSPAAILYELRDMMQSPANDPPILIFFDNGGGHAVTPYRLEHKGDGKFHVWVYDSNMKDDTDQIFEFDTVANTWRYDHQNSLGVWSGNASDKSVGLVPNSKQSASPSCPWCATNLNDAPMMQIWADDDTIVENGSGQRLGPQVATIPEGSWAPILTGATIERAIYLLPATNSYQLVLDGTAEGIQSSSVAQFGPGYALSVQSTDVPDTARRTITTTPDGRSVTYGSTDATTTTITIANDNIGAGLQVAVQDMEVGPNKALAVEVNYQVHSVTVNNQRGSAGTYRLQLERLDGGAKLTFTHTLTLQAGAIQQLSYQQWTAGKDEVTLRVDVNGDGIIDETRVLRDEGSNTIYLPLVRR